MIGRINRVSQSPTSNMSEVIFARWVTIGVLAVWAGMLATILGCITIYSYNAPWREDWLMVPALAGKEANLVHWLWAQNMEHRLPLQKAIYLLLLKVSGGDFRIAMPVNALMLAALCLAMILTARRLRGGQIRLADAFFPLVFLNLGHLENIFLGWQIQFVISTVLICTWLLIIVGARWPLPPTIAVTAGLTLVLLPLSGGNGMIFTPFVALWLAAGTFLYRSEMPARWIIPFQIACLTVSIAVSSFYFVGYNAATPGNPGIGQTIITAARFIGMALGPVGGGRGRAFPRLIGILFCGVGCVLLASGMIPLRCELRSIRPAERFRGFGLLIFAGAMAALGLLIAWGRAGWVPLFGMPGRYALLSVPGLCAVYFAWILYGPETARNRVAIAFAVAVLLALPFNLREGLKGLDEYYVPGMRSFEQDLTDGLSWRELAKRHEKFFMDWDHLAVMNGMQMLQEAKLGPWKSAPR
jgi:hypothetical protein